MTNSQLLHVCLEIKLKLLVSLNRIELFQNMLKYTCQTLLIADNKFIDLMFICLCYLIHQRIFNIHFNILVTEKITMLFNDSVIDH